MTSKRRRRNKKNIRDKGISDARKGGFSSLFDNLGQNKDVLKNTSFSRVYRLAQEVCENVFISSWIGKRIVTLPVQTALKNGLVFECEDNKVEERVWELYKDLKIESLIIEAQKSADIYGSSVLILQDKNQDPLSKAKDYKSLKITHAEYPFYSVSPSPDNLYQGGVFSITNPAMSVDESFCAIFQGEPVIQRLRPDYKYYGMSVYQSIWTALVNDSTIMTAVANITWRSSIRHYRLKGLKEQVLAGRQDQVLDRMSLLDSSASIFGSVVMDAEDEMQVVSQSISGLADIDKRSAERLSAASGIPATILLGKSPDGQNASGDGDDDNFVMFVENYQKKMIPALERIFAVLNSLAGGDDNWSISFRSPDSVDYNKLPDFEQKVLMNATSMLNELGLPQEVVERYLLEHNIITQDEKDLIAKQTLEFDEIDSTENNEI